MPADRPMTPVYMALFAAILWGVWWIPIRYLETLGMDGPWSSTAMNAGAAIAALAWLRLRGLSLKLTKNEICGAFLVGAAVTTYSISITLSDVVRVIILFYLAPAWGKLIEWAFLGQPWRWSSTFAVIASITGAFFVLGGEVSLDALGAGDLLALLSGVAWAAGAALIFTSERSNPVSLTTFSAISATVLGIAFIALGAGDFTSLNVTPKGASAGAAIGIAYVLPIMALTLWSAQRLSPAVISFLLTAEILSGVISSALFLDEPFGIMQAIGASLVFFAALSEVVGSMRARQPEH